MALSSACDLVTTVVSFFASAADAALFFTAGLPALAFFAGSAAEVEVLEVLGFAEASGACLDFTDFETGMNTSHGTNTHKHTKENGKCKQTPSKLAQEQA
jgi:hypothetical protein